MAEQGEGGADFQLAHGIWKSFETVYRSDEAFVRQSSAGGNLPMARQNRTQAPRSSPCPLFAAREQAQRTGVI